MEFRRVLVLLHFLTKCFYSHQCAQRCRFVFGSFWKFSESGWLVALLSKSAGKNKVIIAAGVPLFFRRAREEIEIFEVIKIGRKTWKNWEKTGQNWAKLGKTGENWISAKSMMYFLCVSFCRSGVPSFFRRAREKIEVLKVIKIGKNWEKLVKIGKNWENLMKTG